MFDEENEKEKEKEKENPLKDNHILFNILKCEEEDKNILKKSFKLVESSLNAPNDLNSASLEEIFNLIPEINKNENLKCLFSILFAEICKQNGNILYQKNLLEFASSHINKILGEYNLVNLSISIALSNAYKELGLIDEAFSYLNKALKISYLNTKIDSLENIEVISEFVMFSKYIKEKIEEGIYSEIIVKMTIKKYKNFVKMIDNKIIKENLIDDKDKKSNSNKGKSNFEGYTHNEKFYCLILISFIVKHLDHISSTEKVKNLKYIVSKFKEYDIILSEMGLIKENKFTFENIFSENHIEEIGERIDSPIYLYLHPQIKSLIHSTNLDDEKKSKKMNIY